MDMTRIPINRGVLQGQRTHLCHRRENVCYIFSKYIATQNINDAALMLRVLRQEPRKTKFFCVKGVDELPKCLHSVYKRRSKTSELCFGKVIFLKGFKDSIRCHLTRLECQKQPRRVDGIQEPERIAYQHPIIACDTTGTIGKILSGLDWEKLLRTFKPPLQRRTSFKFLGENLLCIESTVGISSGFGGGSRVHRRPRRSCGYRATGSTRTRSLSPAVCRMSVAPSSMPSSLCPPS